MTPADELRAAADKLRRLAATASDDSGSPTGLPPAYVSAPVGDYIAAMGPGVGAALADWLTEYAASLDKTTHPEWQETVAPRPLAVARAILGGAR